MAFINVPRRLVEIQDLMEQLLAEPDHGPALQAAAARIDRLELLCSALVELLVAKGVATPAELRVLMQQLDLADGVEDRRMSKEVREASPRCSQCQRFLNPRRKACVYCGASMDEAMPKPPVPELSTDVECTGCGRVVPEPDSYFTGQGLVCGPCFVAHAR